ncbi:MAG: hypothetical protein JO372_21075 [Solirubrobacterales bacterium]|nr:hypothetical protein [Solirubrobacterales bacterium]
MLVIAAMALVKPPVGRAGDPPPCSAQKLRGLNHVSTHNNQGRITITFEFVNKQPLCDLKGFPTVVFLKGEYPYLVPIDTLAARVSEERGAHAQVVQLAERGKGYFRLSFTEKESAKCKRRFAVDGLQARYGESQERPNVLFRADVCDSSAEVSPFRSTP